MNPAYEAVLIATRTALEQLDQALASLPDEALTWVPAEGLNSVAVLSRHCITATVYLASCGAGLAPDREEYLRGDRAEAFRTTSATVDQLRSELAALGPQLEPILAHGTHETLAQPAGWAEPDGRVPSCGELAVRTLGHLKEHVGQVEMLRDIWKAR